MRRVLLFFAAAVVLFTASHLRAQAITEICPAGVDIAAIGSSDAHHTQGDTFAFALSAPTSRSIEGRLVLYTDKGWFSAAIPKVDLDIEVPLQQSEPTESWRTRALSVTLPERVTIRRAFLADIITDAQTWAPPAPTICLQGVSAGYSDARPNPRFPYNPPADPANWFTDALTTGRLALHAATTAPLGSTACAQPFAEAKVTHAVTPDAPESAPRAWTHEVVDVGVILRSNGTVQETWLLRSSGIRAFDDTAVRAAEDSIYDPAISLCQSVPGEYIFTVTFSRY